jgi:hypothetical protein
MRFARNRAWDLSPKSSMTNGTATQKSSRTNGTVAEKSNKVENNKVNSVEGNDVTVNFNGGQDRYGDVGHKVVSRLIVNSIFDAGPASFRPLIDSGPWVALEVFLGELSGRRAFPGELLADEWVVH